MQLHVLRGVSFRTFIARLVALRDRKRRLLLRLRVLLERAAAARIMNAVSHHQSPWGVR